MRKALLCFSLLLFVTRIAFAQVYVGESKRSLKFWIGVNAGKYKKTSITTETDSSYTFQIRGADIKPEDLYFLFDKKGDCYYQKWSFECDTCYHKMVTQILGQKKYGWHPDGVNQYLAKPSRHLMLKELQPGVLFTITRVE